MHSAMVMTMAPAKTFLIRPNSTQSSGALPSQEQLIVVPRSVATVTRRIGVRVPVRIVRGRWLVAISKTVVVVPHRAAAVRDTRENIPIQKAGDNPPANDRLVW